MAKRVNGGAWRREKSPRPTLRPGEARTDGLEHVRGDVGHGEANRLQDGAWGVGVALEVVLHLEEGGLAELPDLAEEAASDVLAHKLRRRVPEKGGKKRGACGREV